MSFPFPHAPSRAAVRHAGTAGDGARWLIWLATAALLASQWLAVVHGVTHSRGGLPRGVAPMASTDAAAQTAPSVAAWAQQALKVVIQHDEGSAWCQLLDQLSQPAPAPALAAAGALSPAADGPADTGTAAPAAAGAAAYSARAPPPLLT